MKQQYKKISLELLEEISTSKKHFETITMKKQVAVVYSHGTFHKHAHQAHVEKPERVEKIMARLTKDKLIDRCEMFESEEASLENLLAVHCKSHIENIKTLSSKTQNQRDAEASRYKDVYFSEGSDEAALLAAGGALQACELVASGAYRYAFAVVRPPGHHAGKNGPEGFCLMNNIAIGASHLLKAHKLQRILIIDWDIHHGNGTQEMFYQDNRVLFFSVHRQDSQFFPGGRLTLNDIGEGTGRGFNINVCWNHSEIRDVDYITVWDNILLPVVQEFEPEIILISAGFDAGKNDPLGECLVTPSGFATLLHKLIGFGGVVMVLEGGYNLTSLASSVSSCVKVLLGDESDIQHDSCGLPYDSTWEVVIKTREKFRPFWKSFQNNIPPEVFSSSTPRPQASPGPSDKGHKT